MKRVLLLVLAALTPVAFTACNDEVELEGGLVPAQYIDVVDPLTGAYGGIMENGEALSFEVVRDGRIVRAQLIDDFLGSDCDASLGTLRRVGLRELEKGKFEVERAVFALDPNKCASKIVGRELELVRSGSGSGVKFEVSVLSGNERLYSCEPAATLVGASAALRQSAVECSWVNEKEYLRGELAKIKL